MTREPLPTIAGYDVIELIDVGGFSRVYRAIQRRFDRAVAVKVLNAGFTDERQRRAFERECRVMGQLSSHPNVVTVYDSATTDNGLPAIVMELYIGTYRTVGRLSVPEVVDVGVKIADALDHIHRQGIVHRDLKPHNLFISQHGEPAIADFGISTIGGEHTAGARFTLKYAPPELLREGVSDAAGDVYSLGATLYQLAAGRVPFDGPNEPEVVRQVMVAEPPPLGRSDAPPELDRIIRRCLAKQPSGRPGAAGDVADAFRRIQADVGLPGRRAPGAARAPGTPGRQPIGGALLDGPDKTVGRDGAHSPGSRLGGDPDRVRSDALRPDATELEDNTFERGDDAFARRTPGRARDATPPVATPDPTPDRRSRRPMAVAALGALLVIAGAAIAIATSSGGGDAAPNPTAGEPAATVPAFEILAAPTDFDVDTTAEGFRFVWEVENQGGKIQIHRVGSDDTVIAADSPFVWDLPADLQGSCFAARSVNAEETRVSQSATEPVCTTGR